jgi:hypothetical protein
MENLRAAIEADLADSLEGEWKMAVELTSPDGVEQIYQKDAAHIPANLLGGQVLYFTRRVDPNTGENVIVNQPVCTLRISSLDRVPQDGEKWYIKMPTSPVAGASYGKFVFTPTRPTEHGTDIGFIRIYPQRIEQEGGAGPISS